MDRNSEFVLANLELVLESLEGNTRQLIDYIAVCLKCFNKDELLELAYDNDIEDLSKDFSKSEIIEAISDRLEYMSDMDLFIFLTEIIEDKIEMFF